MECLCLTSCFQLVRPHSDRDSVVKGNVQVSELIAKKFKSHSGGEFVKEAGFHRKAAAPEKSRIVPKCQITDMTHWKKHKRTLQEMSSFSTNMLACKQQHVVKISRLSWSRTQWSVPESNKSIKVTDVIIHGKWRQFVYPRGDGQTSLIWFPLLAERRTDGALTKDKQEHLTISLLTQVFFFLYMLIWHKKLQEGNGFCPNRKEIPHDPMMHLCSLSLEQRS